MKGTEHFKETIKQYLDKRAQEDELFRVRYSQSNRTIDDVTTYILNEVKASGCCGFSDEEIFSMAVHVIDEPDLEIGKPIACNVVVNHQIELTEEEKAEQKALALRRFQEQELQKLNARNTRAKKTRNSNMIQPELSLFDEE